MGATMTNLDPKRWPALFIVSCGPLHPQYAEAVVAFRDHHPWSLSECDEQMWAAAFDAELAALIRERQAEAEAATVERVARYLERCTGCLSGRTLAYDFRREFSSE